MKFCAKKHHILAISGLIFGILTFIYLQNTYKYIFYNMEMQRLFVWDWQWISHDLFRIGGFAVVFNDFILQFFAIRYLGAFITTIASISIILMLLNICLKIVNVNWLFPLCALPVLFLFVNMFSYTYTFINFTTFFIGIFCLWLYSKTIIQTWVHFSTGIIIAILMFLSTGANAFYFAFCAFLFDLFAFERYKWTCFVPLISVLISGLIGVQMGWLATYSKVFTLSEIFLYKPLSHIFVYIGWIFVVICICLFKASKQINKKIKNVVSVVLCSILIIITSTGYFIIVKKTAHIRQEQFAVYNFYAQTEQWNKIIEIAKKTNLDNYMLLNFVNLAYSYNDMLLRNLHVFNQQTPLSLCVKPDATQGCQILMSMIYYRMGNIANAQDFAFESNQYSYNCYSMRTLIRTNIIFGSYSVADKYINILEKTLFYKHWANRQRQYLYNDKAVNDDIQLGELRKSLPNADHFVEREGLYADLEATLDKNPNYKPARDYAIAYLLLSHDGTALRKFIDKFYGTPALMELTPDMQYGIMSITNDEEYCRNHGVSEQIINAYKQHQLQQ